MDMGIASFSIYWTISAKAALSDHPRAMLDVMPIPTRQDTIPPPLPEPQQSQQRSTLMHVDLMEPDGCLLAELPRLGFDVLSVDVFDTAITRCLETPVDVFALTEQRLVGAIGAVAHGFGWLRERAEEEARALARAAGREEVSLADIHACLWPLRPELRPHGAAIWHEEIAAETSVLRPVPEIAELVARVRAKGRRVVFVSDMYLPGAEIDRLLRACGFDPSEGLLVSSETGRTKATGSQWAVLRKLVGESARILHIGDDQWSDVASPRKHGIGGWLFSAARSDRRLGGPLTPAILPYSRLARAARLADPATGTGACPVTADAERDPADFMRRLGETWGAVVVGSFIRWLEEKARQHRLTHLFFCARDGWLPYHAWKAAGCDTRTGVETGYLYVSRRALNLAEAALDEERGKLSARSLERLAAGELPVRTLLSRSNLLQCERLRADAAQEFGGLDTLLKWPEGTWRFRDLLTRHQTDVLRALQPFHEAAAGYLHQTLPSTGRVGIVDIGWHGTLQSSIVRQLGPRTERPALFGFYYGLWPRAHARRPFTGWMEGCFTNDFWPPEERRGLHSAVAILENLHVAPHGSTIGYRLADCQWTPILQDSPIERAQHAAMIAPFQESSVAAVSRLFADMDSSTAILQQLDWKAGLAAIERLSLSPTLEERTVLGKIVHAVEFEHSKFRPLIPDPAEGEAPPWPWRTDWPGGTALAWQDAAKEQAANQEWREVVLAKVHSFRDGLDPRSARMFP
ncbi:HAD family hydrolase [Rhodovastum atsumiense]|uniref:HAD family hydrolase n=1 Tax=Rhodovastum atsumiense TaxID=504468 RepID=UPI00139F2B80|nr:HAD family hydrolase [Rhodovastum atsumiense]